MPFIYVYALSDFITPIPNESGAQAVGTPPFSITTGPTLTRITVEITDNDNNFDEIDNGQRLTSNVTIGGTTYLANDKIFGNYILSNGTDPDLISVSAGINNSGNNPTHFVATLVPLAPNTTYVYTSETNYNGNSSSFDSFMPCFTRGVIISCVNYREKIENLSVGDQITTQGSQNSTINWIGSRFITHNQLLANPKLRPVRITAGSLGHGLPERDLLVSRQHRMLISSKIAKRMFGSAEVLVPAIKLTALPGIYVDETVTEVEYFHILLENHEVIYAEGAATESLYTGAGALAALSPEAREEILTIFPELEDEAYTPEPARLIPHGRQQKRLIARHLKNKQPLQGGAV